MQHGYKCFKVTVFLREAKSRDPRGSVRGSTILEVSKVKAEMNEKEIRGRLHDA